MPLLFIEKRKNLDLKVIISLLPVWRRAIKIARSLASEPLFVRYITWTRNRPAHCLMTASAHDDS